MKLNANFFVLLKALRIKIKDFNINKREIEYLFEIIIRAIKTTNKSMIFVNMKYSTI